MPESEEGGLPRCPVEITLRLIDSKWCVLILRELLYGTRRFGQIRSAVGPVSTKVLTDNLRAMERRGLLERTVFPEVPPHVEYSLTPVGLSLKPILLAMVEWGSAYRESHAGSRPFRCDSGEILLVAKQGGRFVARNEGGDVVASVRERDGLVSIDDATYAGLVDRDALVGVCRAMRAR